MTTRKPFTVETVKQDKDPAVVYGGFGFALLDDKGNVIKDLVVANLDDPSLLFFECTGAPGTSTSYTISGARVSPEGDAVSPAVVSEAFTIFFPVTAPGQIDVPSIIRVTLTQVEVPISITPAVL